MDFYRICERTTKSGKVEIYPEFLVGRSGSGLQTSLTSLRL